MALRSSSSLPAEATGTIIIALRSTHTDQGHAEAAFNHRDAARLPEQLVAIAHAHDQRVDAAQHGVDAVEEGDPGLPPPCAR